MERYRITEDIGVYFVTFTIVEWLPVLTNETACKIITDLMSVIARAALWPEAISRNLQTIV